MFKAIRCKKLIDGSGSAPINDAVVLVEGAKIKAVGKEGDVKVPDGAQVIEAAKGTVMPGLTDVHIHLRNILGFNAYQKAMTSSSERLLHAVSNAKKVLKMGFTTVRDAGGMEAVDLKHGIEEGLILGPRIIAARQLISQTAGHADFHFLPLEWVKSQPSNRLADGADDCRKAVREQFREGADFIKICTTGGTWSMRDLPIHPQFTMDELNAFVDEAHRWGRKVAAHAIGYEGTRNAIIAGVDTIEHGGYQNDELCRMMIEKNIILVPTCAISYLDIKYGEEMGLMEWALRKEKEYYEEFKENLRRAYRLGVKMAVGTDACDPILPFGQNAIELEVLTKLAGLSPMEAIVAATKVGAEAMGLQDQIGTIEGGKLADLIVVDGDPLKDITVLQDEEKMEIVMKNGEIVSKRGQLLEKLPIKKVSV